MKKDWIMWLVIGGLAIDLIDAFTVKSGADGGIFYNSATGVLKTFDASLPGQLHPGEMAAAVGAAFLFMHHRG